MEWWAGGRLCGRYVGRSNYVGRYLGVGIIERYREIGGVGGVLRIVTT